MIKFMLVVIIQYKVANCNHADVKSCDRLHFLLSSLWVQNGYTSIKII